MKKIINGKKYDTDTAKELGMCWNGLAPSDFDYVKETLYRKKTGEYFLYGRGGAKSCYAETVRGDNCWTAGEAIIPYTEDEAKRWSERNLDVDEYEEIFGKVEE